MKNIFVNLKRFDVPKSFGGICPDESPENWIKKTVDETVSLGLGNIPDVDVVYFLPEMLLLPAKNSLGAYSESEIGDFSIGCQGVFREDVKPGGNFGALTSNRPAASVKAIGVDWVMIGHSEERRDKLNACAAFAELAGVSEKTEEQSLAVDRMLGQEIVCAFSQGMNVLFCLGETAEQKGSDDPAVYEPRVRDTLRSQILQGLASAKETMSNCRLAIGYEPVWAIGPGKVPPNADYIGFVSEYIKKVCSEELGLDIPVVYGGGLKEENAEEIAGVSTIDGGLVALTKFTQPIAFDVQSLKNIIQAYVK